MLFFVLRKSLFFCYKMFKGEIVMEMQYDNWWKKGENGDQEMENSHRESWEKIISLLDEDNVKNKRILDYGCNQGGFLRVLYNRIPYQKAYGIDLAKQAIKVAKSRAENYPVSYRVSGDATSLNQLFDTVISTSVLYLIEDLDKHFQMIASVLEKGGIYYATFSDQSKNPSLEFMECEINKYGSTKMQNKTLSEVVDSLINQGFSVKLIKEHEGNDYDVTNYKEFYQSVDDYILACLNSYLIKATKN